MELGTKLRQLRKDAHMTQEDVAGKITPPYSPAAVGAWESGRAKPRLDVVSQLATIFGITTTELLGEEAPTAAVDPATLTADESELVACYRSTDERGREAIMDTARRERGATGQVPHAVRRGA